MRVARFFLACFSLVLVSFCGARELQAFSSDGCSAFPDGTFEQKELWLHCCTQHDFAYWQGGTYQQRKQADKSLQLCVEQVGRKDVAIMMLAGVRVGGSPFWPTKFRWGYGWRYPRFYGKLSAEELKKIQMAIDSARPDTKKAVSD